MKFISKMSLRLKFISGLVLSAFILGACLSLIMYFHFNSIMEKEISHRSEMLLSQARAVQDYVGKVLRPRMFELLDDDRFILQAMSSSYISRMVMERIDGTGEKNIYYRRVARNPRNPLYGPTEFEESLIEKFKNSPDLKVWEEDSEFKGVKYHLVSIPVKFTKSCMSCHGSPNDAPEELKTLYGDKNGFYHDENEVGGVVVAGFPVKMITDPVKEVTLQYLSLYIFWLLLFSCIIGLFFDVLVMKNLKKLGHVFKHRFSGEKEKNIIERFEAKDEIEGLIKGVDELAACLFDANKKLEEHSQNLEEKVRARTMELEFTAEKHLSDLSLFSNLIARFSETIDTEGMIRGALERVGLRYNASQVVYYCTVVSENFFTWREDDSIKRVDSEIKEILWNEKVLFKDNRIYIPVISHESHWGILCLVFENMPDEENYDEAVLLSLGLQLGSSLENIQAVSELKYQNDLLESVFEGITDPLLMIDTRCRIIFANRGSSILFENRNEDEKEKILNNLLNHEERPLIKKVVGSSVPVFTEVSIDSRFFRIYLYPLPMRASGGSLRIVMYARDISIEKDLRKGMEKTERLSSIGRMAAGMAHEINNPLGVIKCYADLLSDELSDDKYLSDIEIITNQTRKVQKIVQNLLNLSRHKNDIFGKCRIDKVAEQTIKLFSHQALSRKVELCFEAHDDIPEIKCDGSTLEQIITNIILNSFDALAKTGGKIVVRAVKEEKEAVLEITDNGAGIKESVKENIFDPFFTTKEVGKGTGLGLSVVYGFISELGGRIEVESDGLTRFKLYFPYYDEKE